MSEYRRGSDWRLDLLTTYYTHDTTHDYILRITDTHTDECP
jgi:hypothetical protein